MLCAVHRPECVQPLGAGVMAHEGPQPTMLGRAHVTADAQASGEGLHLRDERGRQRAGDRLAPDARGEQVSGAHCAASAASDLSMSARIFAVAWLAASAAAFAFSCASRMLRVIRL